MSSNIISISFTAKLSGQSLPPDTTAGHYPGASTSIWHPPCSTSIKRPVVIDWKNNISLISINVFHIPQKEIIKIVATRCQVLRLNEPNSPSVWVLSQNPLGSAPWTIQLDLRGLLLGEGGDGKEVRGGVRKGRWNGRYCAVVKIP